MTDLDLLDTCSGDGVYPRHHWHAATVGHETCCFCRAERIDLTQPTEVERLTKLLAEAQATIRALVSPT